MPRQGAVKPQRRSPCLLEKKEKSAAKKIKNAEICLKRKESPKTATFFDALTDDEVKHTFRFLSAKPGCENGAALAPQSTADSLLQCPRTLFRVSYPLSGLLLDMLSNCAVERMLTFLVRRPTSRICCVPGQTALSLVRTRGALSRVAGKSFPSVIYTKEGKLATAPDPNAYAVKVADDRRLMEDFTGELEAVVHRICICAPMYRTLGLRIAKYCTELRTRTGWQNR